MSLILPNMASRRHAKAFRNARRLRPCGATMQKVDCVLPRELEKSIWIALATKSESWIARTQKMDRVLLVLFVIVFLVLIVLVFLVLFFIVLVVVVLVVDVLLLVFRLLRQSRSSRLTSRRPLRV